MPSSLAFYRDLLGFQVVQAAPAPDRVSDDGFGWAWLRRDSAELMLNTAYDRDAIRPPLPDTTRIAAHDDTTLYIGCPDVDAAYRYLHARGVDVSAPVVTAYGMRQLAFKDPDGFGLCLQWAVDTPTSVAAERSPPT
jgi:uncharacterized glyoxalase superfamily protein PhnB